MENWDQITFPYVFFAPSYKSGCNSSFPMIHFYRHFIVLLGWTFWLSWWYFSGRPFASRHVPPWCCILFFTEIPHPNSPEEAPHELENNTCVMGRRLDNSKPAYGHKKHFSCKFRPLVTSVRKWRWIVVIYII